MNIILLTLAFVLGIAVGVAGVITWVWVEIARCSHDVNGDPERDAGIIER